MSRDGWHAANSSSHPSPAGGGAAADGSGGAAFSAEDEAAAGGYNPDYDAFLAEEEALPNAETKWKDALIFLIDCSSGMQFPCDEESMHEMADAGRIKVKPESGPSGGSWDSAPAAAGGAGGAGVSGSSRDPASAAAASSSSAAAAAASSSPSAARGFIPESSRLTQFEMVFEAVLHSIRGKIISSPDDFVGVCFFGAARTHNDNKFPHIFVHTPLQQLTAAAIRRLDALKDPDEFEAMIGSMPDNDVSKKVEMDKVLWICSTMFQEAQVSNCHKRIVLLSNNDTPFIVSDPLSKARAVQKGKDLRDLDISIDLIAVSKKPGVDGRPKTFNPLLFFRDILIFDESESGDALTATFRTKFADLREALFKKSMKKRALGSIPLQLGAGVSFGIKLYCMLRETKKESAVFLDKETNEKLDTQTRWLDKSTGSVLKEFEIQRYYPYGGVKVVLSPAELKKIKDLGDPGLVLMGFKPYSALKVGHNIKNPYFIYPDDSQFADSSRAFKALLLGMHQLRQIALCRLIYRKGSVPRFVALVPQMAKIDSDSGEVLQAPGFNLIFLPYADDIRALKFEPTPIATAELITDAKKIVEKLTVKALPLIQNPVLQQHYRVIQAIALGESEPAPVVDELVPDAEGMAKYAPLISGFAADARALGEAAQAEMEPATRGKRKAGGDGDGTPKKPKKEDPDYSSIDWKQSLDNDTLKKLTVPVLKVYCRQHKLPLAGTKADVLERVTSHLLSA